MKYLFKEDCRTRLEREDLNVFIVLKKNALKITKGLLSVDLMFMYVSYLEIYKCLPNFSAFLIF